MKNIFSQIPTNFLDDIANAEEALKRAKNNLKASAANIFRKKMGDDESFVKIFNLPTDGGEKKPFVEKLFENIVYSKQNEFLGFGANPTIWVSVDEIVKSFASLYEAKRVLGKMNEHTGDARIEWGGFSDDDQSVSFYVTFEKIKM